jgi:O-antigen/teichoic acid export membrane protein
MYYVIVLWIPLQILNSYLTSILTAQMRFAEQFWINLVQGSSVILFVFLVVSTLNSTVTGAIVALVAATVVTDVLQLWFVRYGIQRYEMWPSFQLMRCCLSFGLRGYFANLAQFVTYRFDSFIVGSMLGMSALGVYAGAYTASEILFYIPNCIATVVFPATAGSSTEAANWRTAAVCRMTFTFAFIAGLVGATTAHWLYPAILGDKFSYSTVLFWALLPGTVMLSGTKVMTADMLGRGFPQYASRGSIGAMILVAILDLCFIPRLGLIAAAIISSLVYGLQTAYYVSCFLRVTGLRLATLVLVTGDDLRILKGLVFAYTKPLIGKLIPLHEAK